MRREREQVNAKCIDINRKFSRGLHGIDMERNFSLFGDTAQCRDRLNRANFMISETDGRPELYRVE